MFCVDIDFVLLVFCLTATTVASKIIKIHHCLLFERVPMLLLSCVVLFWKPVAATPRKQKWIIVTLLCEKLVALVLKL